MPEVRAHLHRATCPFPQRQRNADLPRLRNEGGARKHGHQHRGTGQDPRHHPRQVHPRIRRHEGASQPLSASLRITCHLDSGRNTARSGTNCGLVYMYLFMPRKSAILLRFILHIGVDLSAGSWYYVTQRKGGTPTEIKTRRIPP